MKHSSQSVYDKIINQLQGIPKVAAEEERVNAVTVSDKSTDELINALRKEAEEEEKKTPGAENTDTIVTATTVEEETKKDEKPAKVDTASEETKPKGETNPKGEKIDVEEALDIMKDKVTEKVAFVMGGARGLMRRAMPFAGMGLAGAGGYYAGKEIEEAKDDVEDKAIFMLGAQALARAQARRLAAIQEEEAIAQELAQNQGQPTAPPQGGTNV